MNHIRTRFVAAVAAVAAALLPVVTGAPRATAGCLAPADVRADVSGQIGPFWGDDGGTLLYARGVGTGQELVLKGLGQFAQTVASAGDRNRFQVGAENETWATFHSGATNERGDVAFVASTTIRDDLATPDDESLPRRGAYAQHGNTMFEIGRNGSDSQIPLPFGGFVPWGSFFDAVPAGRIDTDPLVVFFSAQLGGTDGRQGIFRWDEISGAVTPLVLTGESSPAGGPFTTFGRLRCNEAGDLVFYALTQINGSAPIAPGLFRIDRSGSRGRVAKFGSEGDAAPGGGTFALMQDFDVDGDGGVVFAASVDGAPAASGLFRAGAPTFQPERVVAQGAATPLGGSFGAFSRAQVRCDETGAATFVVPLSADAGGGNGLFFVQPGGSTAQPLGTADEPLAVASLGSGRVAYQTATETRTIVPADGSEEGPGDFRVALLDVKNAVALKRDGLSLDARFRLPPWGTGTNRAPVAAFDASGGRLTSSGAVAEGDIAKIVEVRLQISQSPGQSIVFGVTGVSASQRTAPKGTVTINGTNGVASVVVSKAGDAATWKFTHPVAKGSFAVDLSSGTAKLSAAQANLFPSFDAANFRVELTLRTADDIAGNRTGAAAHFFRSVRLDADQPSFGTGRRVVSRGERIQGGTFYVDSLRVDRKLKVVKGQASPQVASDSLKMAGVVRLCPGSTVPTTPTLGVDITLGDLVLDRFPLQRVGRSGSKYAGHVKSGATDTSFLYDAVKGTFTFAARGVASLSQLADADFTPGAVVNPSNRAVGGMALPVSISIDRAYASSFELAMTRLPGGKAFVK
ncbi:MAG: hypothetical protein K8T90_11305 [Planctomycetes bacterium]|nr:hypothetical protein [Planctomycetota bacterium]